MAVDSSARRRPSRPAAGRVGSLEAPRARLLWFITIAALLASLIWARMAYWQITQHSLLTTRLQAQDTSTVTLPALRGQILDRNGIALAVDVTKYDVAVAPDLVPASSRDAEAKALAKILNVPDSQVMTVLSSGGAFAYLARAQSKSVAAALTNLQAPGVSLLPVQVRQYLPGGVPGTSLAASLLGFVDQSGQGQRGVEAFYQSQLAGKDGHSATYKDLAGNQITLSDRPPVNPVNGQNLTLTIDSNIQYAAEQALAAGVQRNHAQSGSVLVMDAKTGGILAWANYPSYDANNVTSVASTLDPIVSDLYEPGSVMKVVTLSGAIDAGAITPQSTLNDQGTITVDGVVLHDDADVPDRGTVTMTKVLEDSLNVGAVTAWQREGTANLVKYLNRFGFGSASHVDVAGEASQPLSPLGQWGNLQAATTSFGQGIDVNMVQMTAAENVVANGGRYAPPHVVQSIDGQPNAGYLQQQPQVVSPQTNQQMVQMMQQVVQNGSGHLARVNCFQNNEGGKTGTSQIPVNGSYTNSSASNVWASYTGFLPATNPAFTMLVMVTKPNNGSNLYDEGYYVSGPIWAQIAQSIITDEHITPSSPCSS